MNALRTGGARGLFTLSPPTDWLVESVLAASGPLMMLTLRAEADRSSLGWPVAAFSAGMALFSSPFMTAILNAHPQDKLELPAGSAALPALAWRPGGGGPSGEWGARFHPQPSHKCFFGGAK